MNILISGSTGLVGSAIVAQLENERHRVVRLVRRAPESDGSEVGWNPESGEIDTSGLEAMDAVIHLAGENIAEGRWNDGKKARIRDSRVNGTRLLAESLAGLTSPPRTLIAASAIGYYGDRGDAVMTEDSTPASDFLGETCQAWEAAVQPAVKRGIRTVNLRIGVVLSLDGGALARMHVPFRMGVGGVIGGGDQYVSWISIHDLPGIVQHLISKKDLSGPINAVAPNPVTNREFTKTLGRILGRPTLFPMPAFAARLAFGEMADALLLASTRAAPKRLEASGYVFRHPDIASALREILEK
jgi:uncharacterized protein (TIGR01777 family)